ncbi:LamG-like jellyroll fold domain-containing protein [Actinokineospora inagensis]|uniref:LamG-like jellyroll fold domain-containing protein n=1 Tax=Actinokineospora inagensis TaxID=103730 RepID=UPI0012F788BD|nr:LamG-like jellyroll fold domain-containing protein [Actinokineospora inagensis]
MRRPRFTQLGPTVTGGSRTRAYACELVAFVAGATLSVLVWLVFWSVAPFLVGWQSHVVLSGSMSPAIRPGDVVVVGGLLTDHPAPGAVLAFDDPTHADRTLLHRLVRVDPDAGLITKGDANAEADSTPITEDAVHGQGRLRVPWVGLPSYWVHSGDWLSLTIALVALVGLTALAWTFGGRPVPAPPPRPLIGIGGHAPGPIAGVRNVEWLTAGAVATVVLLVASVSGGFAAFTGTGGNTGNGLGAATTFPTYSASVTGDSPLFYHRQEESQSSSSTSTAADSSGNSRPGQYNNTTNGPSTHWRFDEGTGTNAGDSSGGVNTGVLTNGPTWTTGIAGGAVNFDGVNDRVASVNPSPVATDTSFSVSMWVKTTSASATAVAFTQQGSNVGAWYLYQQGGKWRFGLPRSDASSGTEDYAQSTTSVVANTWVHLVGVYDDPNNVIKLYVNGSLEASTARADAYEWKATGWLVAGSIYRGGSWLFPWAGALDEGRIYARVVGASEVSGIYGAATAPNAQYNMEQTGTTATDSGPFGYTGTLQNGATWSTSGRTGRALSLDGVDDYVSASTFVMRTDTSFTAAAWVYISSAGGADRTFLAKDGTNVNSFALSYITSTGKYAFTMPASDSAGASTVRVSSSTSALANAWTYVVGVWDSINGQMKIYLNGALEGTTSRGGGWNATGQISIGRGYNGGGAQYWPGKVDEVQFYNRAVTAAEIDDIYTRPSLDWQYDDNLAVTVSDSSGNGNSGAMNNVQWSDTAVAGTSGYFDGSSSWTVSQAASLRTDESFTVSGWAYLTTPNGDRSIIAQQGTVGSGYLLGADISSTRWCFRIPRTDTSSPTYDAVYSQAIAQQNGWYHIVGVYQAGAETLKLYVNGVLQDSTTRGGTKWNATGTVQTGRALRSGSQMDYFYGYLDKIRTIQAALSASQVQDLYNEQSPPPDPLPVAGALSPMTAGAPGALQGAQQGQSSSTAVAFNGAGNAANLTSFANPTSFTIETWFRTGSPWGGLITGFYDTTSSSSTNRDRLLYIDNTGKLVFAVKPATVKSITSTASYTDATWHHVAASLGTAGMKLYVDGNLIAQDATTTTAQNFTGYWRWGGGTLVNYPNRPSSDYLVGTLDELAVYPTQLTDAQIRRHYHANH